MIKLSDNALIRLRELRKKNNKRFVRLDVKGGGCAGFEYQWSYADEEQRNDAIIDDVLLVNRDYELYLMGLELDYTFDDFESMFKFNNPKDKSTCGCGTSFSCTAFVAVFICCMNCLLIVPLYIIFRESQP